jgi:hypothetical protein
LPSETARHLVIYDYQEALSITLQAFLQFLLLMASIKQAINSSDDISSAFRSTEEGPTTHRPTTTTTNTQEGNRLGGSALPDEDAKIGQDGFIMDKFRRLKNRQAQHRYRINKKAKFDALESETSRLKAELEAERQRCHQFQFQVANLNAQLAQKDTALKLSEATSIGLQTLDEASTKQATDTLILDIHKHMAICLPFQHSDDSDPRFHGVKPALWELIERMIHPQVSFNLFKRIEVPGVKSFGTEDELFWRQIILLLGFTPAQRAAMASWKANLMSELDTHYGKQLLLKIQLLATTDEPDDNSNDNDASTDASAVAVAAQGMGGLPSSGSGGHTDGIVWPEQQAFLQASSSGLSSALSCSVIMTTAVHKLGLGLRDHHQMVQAAIRTFYFDILSPKQALVLFMHAPLCCWNVLALVNSVEKHYWDNINNNVQKR